MIDRFSPLIPEFDERVKKLITFDGMPLDVAVAKEVILLMGTCKLRAVHFNQPVQTIDERFTIACPKLVDWHVMHHSFDVIGGGHVTANYPIIHQLSPHILDDTNHWFEPAI